MMNGICRLSGFSLEVLLGKIKRSGPSSKCVDQDNREDERPVEIYGEGDFAFVPSSRPESTTD